jgi:hypothetical protein
MSYIDLRDSKTYQALDGIRRDLVSVQREARLAERSIAALQQAVEDDELRHQKEMAAVRNTNEHYQQEASRASDKLRDELAAVAGELAEARALRQELAEAKARLAGLDALIKPSLPVVPEPYRPQPEMPRTTFVPTSVGGRGGPVIR